MIYPKIFSDLVEDFKSLPGIGEKTAERLVFSLLDFDETKLESYGNNIINLKKQIKYCNNCGVLTDTDTCNICKDISRKKDTVIVVENSKDVFLIEKTGTFRGMYHVLGGLISPIDEIGPDDISIDKLVERVEKEKINEVILAIKSGIEADTTALYIKKILEEKNVKVSRIASGIPVGADMEYVDSLTLQSALNNRNEVL